MEFEDIDHSTAEELISFIATEEFPSLDQADSFDAMCGNLRNVPLTQLRNIAKNLCSGESQT